MLDTLKYVHIFSITMGVLLIVVRYWLMVRDSDLYNSLFFKRFSPVVDSVMLFSGIALVFITNTIPFTENGQWMTEKLLCLIAYFLLIFLAFRSTKGKLFRSFAFFGGLGWLIMAAHITVSKTPFLG